jgi:hypothetical protein
MDDSRSRASAREIGGALLAVTCLFKGPCVAMELPGTTKTSSLKKKERQRQTEAHDDAVELNQVHE